VDAIDASGRCGDFIITLKRNGKPMEILDAYVDTGPNPQAIINIFNGEWSSKMPGKSGLTSLPGTAALFEDNRIDWLSSVIGGFQNKKILELGPLEAGHTYMMHNAGAKSITAIEANSRSYLKCLCIKEIFGLDRAKFVYADAMAYTAESSEQFDLCVASGILYHMIQPVEFIEHIARMSKTIFLWTHYYDESLKERENLARQFETPHEIKVSGKTYTVCKRNYEQALKWAGFCGGSKPWALWLTRDSLFSALESFGLHITMISFDELNHQNGPSIALVASRK
jgi:hypothetical protein